MRGSAERGLGGEPSGRAALGGCARRCSHSGKVTGRPSATISGLGAKAGPQPGPRRRGRGPWPRRAGGSEGGDAGPALPAAPALAAQARKAPPTTRVTCAPRTLPLPGLGARGRAGRPQGPQGGGSGGGLGTGPAARTRLEPADAARGRADGLGRGLSLRAGPVAEAGAGNGARGPVLPAASRRLVYSWRGSFNPKGGRAAGKTRSWICEPPEREWGGGGADGGADCGEDAKAAAFLEGSSQRRPAQLCFCCWFGEGVFF